MRHPLRAAASPLSSNIRRSLRRTPRLDQEQSQLTGHLCQPPITRRGPALRIRDDRIDARRLGLIQKVQVRLVRLTPVERDPPDANVRGVGLMSCCRCVSGEDEECRYPPNDTRDTEQRSSVRLASWGGCQLCTLLRI